MGEKRGKKKKGRKEEDKEKKKIMRNRNGGRDGRQGCEIKGIQDVEVKEGIDKGEGEEDEEKKG